MISSKLDKSPKIKKYDNKFLSPVGQQLPEKSPTRSPNMLSKLYDQENKKGKGTSFFNVIGNLEVSSGSSNSMVSYDKEPKYDDFISPTIESSELTSPNLISGVESPVDNLSRIDANIFHINDLELRLKESKTNDDNEGGPAVSK